jgi:hypothetical protein
MAAMAEGLSETSYKTNWKSHGHRVHFVEWKHRTLKETFSPPGEVNLTDLFQDCKQQSVGQ